MKVFEKRHSAVWIALAVIIIGCGAYGQAWGDKGSGSGKLPPPEAAAFWDYVTRVDSYQKWSLYPGRDSGLSPAAQRGITPGRNPHGAYMKLHGNDIAIKAAKEAHEKPMPPGAILIEENYDKDKKTLLSITIMYKVKGYNPGAGDWFWAIYAPDGKAAESGKVQSCIDCHKAKKEHDWRYVGAKSHHHHK